MKVSYLEIFFENCEVARFKAEDIIRLYMRGLGVNMYGETLANHVQDFLVEIRKDAKAEHADGFDEKDFNGWEDRISRDDIVGVTIGYENNQAQTFYVAWSEDDDDLPEYEQKNRFQKVLPTNVGQVVIVSKNKKCMADFSGM